MSVYVSEIKPDGAAVADGRVRVGDELLEVRTTSWTLDWPTETFHLRNQAFMLYMLFIIRKQTRSVYITFSFFFV